MLYKELQLDLQIYDCRIIFSEYRMKDSMIYKPQTSIKMKKICIMVVIDDLDSYKVI